MRLLRSYRWRRRIIITTIVVGAGAPLIWLAVSSSHPAPSNAPTGPEVAGPSFKAPKTVPFTREARREVHRVLAAFISTAVARENVADSWKLVGPGLRQSLTQKQWNTGAIPVPPYPVSKKDLGVWDQVQYSYAGAVGLETILWPKPGSGARPLSVDVDVIKSHHGDWRVNYFMPTKFRGPPALSKAGKERAQKAQAQAAARRRAAPTHAAPPLPAAPHLKGAWWTIPLFLLGLAILLPISLGVFFWLRNRRAAAAWARSKRG